MHVWLERAVDCLQVRVQVSSGHQNLTRCPQGEEKKVNPGNKPGLFHIPAHCDLKGDMRSGPEPPGSYFGSTSLTLPELQMCLLKLSGCSTLNRKADAAGAFGTWNLARSPKMQTASGAYSTVLQGVWQALSFPLLLELTNGCQAPPLQQDLTLPFWDPHTICRSFQSVSKSKLAQIPNKAHGCRVGTCWFKEEGQCPVSEANSSVNSRHASPSSKRGMVATVSPHGVAWA